MRKILLTSVGICLTLIFSTLSLGPSHAEGEENYLTVIGDWSCAAPKTCSAITPRTTEFGYTLSIVAWDGYGNSWKNGREINLNSDPINKRILEDNDIRTVRPVALMCMSVGNCEGLVIGVGDDTPILLPGRMASRTSKKPFKSIYFSISQIDSVWQTPKHIQTLTFTQKHELVAMNYHAAIHCTTHGECIIAGNSGGPTRERLVKSFGEKGLFGEEQIDTKPFFISQENGEWGAPQFPMVNKLQNQGSTFYTLKCKSDMNCEIQGGYVPTLSLMNRLKSQNNMKKELANKAILSLGFTLELSNGLWGEPKTNLGGAFKKGPFPKGDPKVQVTWTANDNNYNDLTNMMPCIKTEKCIIGPISSSAQP